MSCGARLAPFDIAELREVTAYDELELDKIGDRKTALFCIVSDTDMTFNFISAMVYKLRFRLRRKLRPLPCSSSPQAKPLRWVLPVVPFGSA